MTSRFLPLAQTNQFSSLFLDYISRKDTLQPFYNAFPTPEAFGLVAGQRTFDAAKRETLHQVLSAQYANLDNPAVLAQIDRLRQPNTFTVTTGHQLNIFSGPLYVIYKLVTVTNLAKQLNAAYPDFHFVPVYWMATEDHDFAEINHFHLFGKKYAWETDQTGAVGRMNPQGMATVLAQLPEKFPVFEQAYLQNETLAAATRQWAVELFGEQGLVCVDGDHPMLKAQFASVMRTELLDQVTMRHVTATSDQLTALGYKPQVNARDCNLFYLDHGVRERVVPTANGFEVLNRPIAFSHAEMEKLLADSPEKLSPNVLLRPVYQETVLPNVAYVGGPAELTYWLQLKGLFDALHTPFPVLVPRNFALVVNAANGKKLEKTGLAVADLFLDENLLKRRFVEQNVAEPVSLEAEQASLARVFDSVLQKAVALDKSLEGLVGAERQKALTALENIGKRLKKTEEQKQETGIQQLLGLKTKLFPDGGLQERYDNFLNFQTNRPDFLSDLHQHFDPFRFEFQVLAE